VISGGHKLKGKVHISGAKNAALAILPAAILSDGVCRIENLPNISDITLMCRILADLGVGVKMVNEKSIEIDPRKMKSNVASYELMRSIRASCYLLGALLAKFNESTIYLPGGCDFGTRPIDQHLKGFTALGATHNIDGGMINVRCERLVGSNVYMDVVSVGATVNIMLAAVKAEGLTVIENAAKEPHIVDLANFLNCMGADIVGAGTDIIKIKGVKSLKGTNYSIIPDQIEAGTYLTAAVATGGEITIESVTPKHLESITAKLKEIGAELIEGNDSIHIKCSGALKRCNVKTMPHPGFPTDMQPQITTLLSIVPGTSIVNEAVWDNRFRYIEELRRMGANISVDGRLAVIEGVENLTGAPVKATDLRAGSALVIAGLAAKGKTVISNIHHIERGYESIVEKLRSLGADICRISEEEIKSTEACSV